MGYVIVKAWGAGIYGNKRTKSEGEAQGRFVASMLYPRHLSPISGVFNSVYQGWGKGCRCPMRDLNLPVHDLVLLDRRD